MVIMLKSWHLSLPIVTFVFTNYDICINPLWCFSLPTVVFDFDLLNETDS